jgi:hypothetical protein
MQFINQTNPMSLSTRAACRVSARGGWGFWKFYNFKCNFKAIRSRSINSSGGYFYLKIYFYPLSNSFLTETLACGTYPPYCIWWTWQVWLSGRCVVLDIQDCSCTVLQSGSFHWPCESLKIPEGWRQIYENDVRAQELSELSCDCYLVTSPIITTMTGWLDETISLIGPLHGSGWDVDHQLQLHHTGPDSQEPVFTLGGVSPRGDYGVPQRERNIRTIKLHTKSI